MVNYAKNRSNDEIIDTYLRNRAVVKITGSDFIASNQQRSELNHVLIEFGEHALLKSKRSILSSKTVMCIIPRFLKLGLNNFVKRLHNLKIVKPNSKDQWIILFGEQEAERKWQEKAKKCAITIEKIGENRYNAIKEYKKGKNPLDHWLLKYTEDEAHNKYNEYIALLKRRKTIEGYIEKYGADLGIQKFNERYKDGSLSLSKFVKKYGEIDGPAKLAIIRNKISSKFNTARASKESLKVFLPILWYCQSLNLSVLLGFENNKEWFLMNIKDKEFYYYDFTIVNLKLIFEFNGEHVHPRKDTLSEIDWKSWRCAWTNKTADEAYNRDQRKIHTAENNGFKVIQLWRNDGVEQNIEKCINEIESHLYA